MAEPVRIERQAATLDSDISIKVMASHVSQSCCGSKESALCVCVCLAAMTSQPTACWLPAWPFDRTKSIAPNLQIVDPAQLRLTHPGHSFLWRGAGTSQAAN